MSDQPPKEYEHRVCPLCAQKNAQIAALLAGFEELHQLSLERTRKLELLQLSIDEVIKKILV